MSSRVPDVQFLLDQLLGGTAALPAELQLDPAEIGIVGHSFGGWTALLPRRRTNVSGQLLLMHPEEVPSRNRESFPRNLLSPGVETFQTLYLAAENDYMTPLPGMYELFERTPRDKTQTPDSASLFGILIPRLLSIVVSREGWLAMFGSASFTLSSRRN